MDIEQIRSALTSEINPTPLSELDENELASVLIIILQKTMHLVQEFILTTLLLLERMVSLIMWE